MHGSLRIDVEIPRGGDPHPSVTALIYDVRSAAELRALIGMLARFEEHLRAFAEPTPPEDAKDG